MKWFVASLLTAGLAGAPAVAAPTSGLAGAVYQTSASNPAAVAVGGAVVYVHALPGRGTWIGPVVTDGYGRFTFPQLANGQYLLRVYVGPRKLWEQVATAPGILDRIVTRYFEIWYYSKPADAGRVERALAGGTYSVTKKPRVDDLQTDTIWFGAGVAIEDVKALAETLIRGGVRLHAIRRFADDSVEKSRLVEIGSSPQHTSDPPLSYSAVASAQDFPRAR